MSGRSRSNRGGRGRPARISQRRQLKKTLLIVCEGKETEWNYFDQLKRQDTVRSKFAITVKRGRGGSRVQIVQRAVDLKNSSNTDYDKAYCVMDVESLSSIEVRIDLDSAVSLASENQITLRLSNPAFEVWFLAHFDRTSRTFGDCDAVVVALNRHWEQQFGASYSKNDARVYEKLSARTEQAIENAKAVLEQDHGDEHSVIDCNSSTEVHILVEELLSS